MSERYSRLYALPERLYTENAPVLILAGALLKDNQTGRVLAQLKFRSLSAVPIRALKISLRAFDVTGTELRGVAEQQYLDLDVRLGASFGEKTAVFLPDSVTRSFSCACTAAVFADGSTWTAAEDAVWEPLHPQQSLKTALGGLELLDQYRRETSQRAEYVVTEDRGLWLCACGTPNPKTEVTCMSCGTNRERVLAALDVKALKAHADELAAEKARKAEEKAKRAAEAARLAAEEKERRKKQLAKVRKWLAIAAAAAAVLAAAILITTKVIIPNSKYNTAVKLLEEEKYDEAIAAFEALGDYKDAAEMKREADDQKKEMEQAASYQKAVQLLENGNYDEAIAAFRAIEGYGDSTERIEECYKLKYDKYGAIYATLEEASVGDIVAFGLLEQDGNAENGKEPIEWQVYDVKTDSSNTTYSLVSVDAILASGDCIDERHVIWASSAIGTYIKQKMSDVFTEAEQDFLVDIENMGKFGVPKTADINTAPIERECKPSAQIGENLKRENGCCDWLVIYREMGSDVYLGYVGYDGKTNRTIGTTELGIRVTIEIELP